MLAGTSPPKERGPSRNPPLRPLATAVQAPLPTAEAQLRAQPAARLRLREAKRQRQRQWSFAGAAGAAARLRLRSVGWLDSAMYFLARRGPATN